MILKGNDDIDALSPTNSSPKKILQLVSRYKWQVLKIKILGEIWFSKSTLQHVFSKRWFLQCEQPEDTGDAGVAEEEEEADNPLTPPELVYEAWGIR